MTKAKKNEIDKYKIIGNFLNKFPNYGTRHGYKSGLKRFFDFMDKNPDEYIRADYRMLENGDKIKLQDMYENDITSFWNDMIKNNIPPKTIKYYIASIRVLLQHYRITLDEVFWKDLCRRGTGSDTRTTDEPITNEILEEILIHGETKARALFLTTASSGMRIGEVLQLKSTDINLNVVPAKITVRAEITKNKTRRICFISNEATRYLKEWLKERDSYLKTACARTCIKTYHGLITKSLDDETVFPFDVDTARNIWNRLIKKAGYDKKDENTGRYKYHIHGLRKFFKTNFSKHNTDIAELLMGHNGYLNKEYLRYTEEQLSKEYIKGTQYLCVFDRPLTDVEQQRVIEDLQEQVEILMEHYKELQAQP